LKNLERIETLEILQSYFHQDDSLLIDPYSKVRFYCKTRWALFWFGCYFLVIL